MTSTVHSVRVDNVPPSGSIEINDDASWTNSASVTLGLSASDGGSGLDKMRLRNAGESWTDNWIDFSATQVWTLTVGDGSKQVDVEYRDVAGNSEQYADSISLDTTAPGVALTAVAQGTVVELEWSASDAGAGLDGCELVYQEGEGSWQALSTSCSGTDTFTPTLPRVWYTFHLTATVPSTALRGCCANNVSNTAVATATASVRDCTKYYYLGAQRVAMRDADDDVFWLHGDHLGSTSFTTDEEGDVVARQLYYPFGETRWTRGTLPTDFGYTGQRDDAYTQLYQMGARWYDSSIGRWISPDTIIPDPANPQSLNRYSYVFNNALRYSDPSGHGIKEEVEKLVEKGWNALTTSWNTVQDLKGIATYAPYVVYPDSFCVGNLACWGGIEEGRKLFNKNVTEPQQRREELGEFASRHVQELAHTNSLEAMALLAEYVAAHTKTSNDFMNDMALSILGSEGLESTVLPVMSRGAGLTFNSRGFNETYADPSIENNQVNHFWFFVNAVYQLGPGATGTVDLFAVLHETDLPVIGGAAGGASIQDYHLSLLGIELGTSIYSGSIIPGEVADWIRDRIGR